MNIINPYSYAGVQDGQVLLGTGRVDSNNIALYISRDFGETWTLSITLPGVITSGWLYKSTVSTDGKRFFTTYNYGGFKAIWSQDGGNTWNTRSCYGVGDMSPDGKVLAIPNPSYQGTDVSRDYGVSWSSGEGTLSTVYETHVSHNGSWMSVNSEGYYDFYSTTEQNSWGQTQYGPSDPYVCWGFKNDKGVNSNQYDNKILVVGGSDISYSLYPGYFYVPTSYGSPLGLAYYQPAYRKKVGWEVYAIYDSTFYFSALSGTNEWTQIFTTNTGGYLGPPDNAEATNKYLYSVSAYNSRIGRLEFGSTVWNVFSTPIPFYVIGANYVLP